MTEEKLTIEKLDGSNWVTWKFQMKHSLLAKDLWGYVDGSVVLAADATADVITAHTKNSQKALAFIVLAIKPCQLYLVTSCITPIDAWNCLCNHYEVNSLGNKLYLKKQYFRAEMKTGTSVDSHIKYMKELSDRLASIGSPIADEDQVVALLGSLPSNYDSLVTALEARLDNISIGFVQQMLKHEEQKQNLKVNVPDDKALYSDQSRKYSNSNNSNYNRTRCFHCNKLGHIQRNCPSRSNANKSYHKAKPVEEVDGEDDFLFMVAPSFNDKDKWIVDSGASSHMTFNRSYFTSFTQYDNPEKVGLGDGRTLDAIGFGLVKLNLLKGSHSSYGCAKLVNVLYVPNLACNLFSVRAAAVNSKSVEFGADKCFIRAQSGNICGEGVLLNKLYLLNCVPVLCENFSNVARDVSYNIIHQRLGHICDSRIKYMVNKNLVDGLKVAASDNIDFCEACVKGKMVKKTFKPLGYIRSSRKLQLIHSDLCGPMNTLSHSGKKYFLTFTDDFTRYSHVYFLSHKDQVFEKFKDYFNEVTNDSGLIIEKLNFYTTSNDVHDNSTSLNVAAIRTDNGGEYLSSDFLKYLQNKGIKHELIVPYCSEQNGVSERLNRTLMESARSMLNHANLPKIFWAEAVATAVFLKNRVVTSLIKEATPYERWNGRKPNLKNLRVFGCSAYALIPKNLISKLDERSKRMCFVGYATNPTGYRLYDFNTKKMFIRRDVIFNEDDFKSMTDDGSMKQALDSVVEIDDTFECTDIGGKVEDVQTTSRPQRDKKAPIKYGIDEYADVAAEDIMPKHYLYNVFDINEPLTFKEAMNSEHSEEWSIAAKCEIDALHENHTWDLVQLPANRKALKSKWVFKIKYNNNNEIDRYKCRLVARGFEQKYGLDFTETFAPVIKYSSLRFLIAFGVQNNMCMHQMDVITAFLNGKLEEDIYMVQPEGFVEVGMEEYVCKLNRSLYGLKQAPRCWNKVLSEYLLSLGFIQSNADPCVFILINDDDTCIIAVYVDDLIIFSILIERLEYFKSKLSSRFKMKDLGSLHYCLGITIDYIDGGVKLHQQHYIEKMLKKFRLSDVKICGTPLDVNVELVKNDGISNSCDKQLYQSMVGNLIYASVSSRPDISYAVGVVSKFSSNPTEAHLSAVKHIFRYLKGTASNGIVFRKSDTGNFCGYSDANWAGDCDDRKSTSGYLFLLCNGPVSWLSKKQSVVALSTAESEYIALSTAAQEFIWFKKLMADIKFCKNDVNLFVDNQSAISICHDSINNSRTKHIDIKFHFVRDLVKNGDLKLSYCPSNQQLADMFTKQLPKSSFQIMCQSIGVQ